MPNPFDPAPAIARVPTDINVNEPVQVDYWVERFGVSAREVGEHLGKM